MVRQAHQNSMPLSKAAPWSQSNTTLGMGLEEIQKAEKLKRAEQAALLQQQRLFQLQQQQIVCLSEVLNFNNFACFQEQQQQTSEKVGSIHLKWASKPIEPRKVKSFAEIQAEEEQERFTKVRLP